MADFQMPNVDGMNSMDELKNAVGKMAKELGWLLNNIDWKNINELNISLNGGASVIIANEGITVNDGTKNTFTVNTAGQVMMTGAKVQSSENGYPRVEMNPDQNLFGAYSAANNYLTIQALPGTVQSPQVVIAGPNWDAPVIGGTSYVPVRTAANELGLEVAVEGNEIKLTTPEETKEPEVTSPVEQPVEEPVVEDDAKVKEIEIKIDQVKRKIASSKTSLASKEKELEAAKNVVAAGSTGFVNVVDSLQESYNESVQYIADQEKELSTLESQLAALK